MTKLTFISDLHYYSPTLGTNGRAYELRSGSDQKCLAESGAIIDSAFSMIAQSDTDAVLIAGDITNNGETVSHNELRQKLYELKKSKPVYLITATHDWCCDKNPRRFDGGSTYRDVPTMPSEALGEFYADFGPCQAIDKYVTHLGTVSYTVDVGEKVRVLCLNDDQNGRGKAGFTSDHFDWIEKQIKKAVADGKFLIGMEHHLLMSHIHPMLCFGSVCVGDKEYVASRLADAGLRYMVVGHSHMQSIECFTSKKGNKLYEINVGSLVGYPSPIVEITVNSKSVSIKTLHSEKIVFEGKEYDTLQYTQKHSLALVDNLFDAAVKGKEEFCQRLTALGIPQEKAQLFYIVARPMAKYIRGMTVYDGYKKIRFLGLSKLFDKDTVEHFRDKKIMDFTHEIYLSTLDGSKNRHAKGSPYYKAVMDFMLLPIKIKDCSTTRNLRDLAGNILTGNEYDINCCSLPNLYE